jgi:hypothetical protein
MWWALFALKACVMIDRAGEQQTQPLMHAASFDVVGATSRNPYASASRLHQQ